MCNMYTTSLLVKAMETNSASIVGCAVSFVLKPWRPERIFFSLNRDSEVNFLVFEFFF